MEELAGFLEEMGAGVLWFIFLAVIAFTALAAAALYYHWREYTTDAQRGKLMFGGYLAVAGTFALIMLLALLFYQNGA
ncbi:MAG: hypothetical protein A2Y84_01005 [Candidatus Colwellbacteria bacterium RBG_13_48_8]|uniref:Uncharacterized protein n=1 Tax=Candidatus Colwellbacteria bacterium RBG_13_48_8 TaxID=1797685 RepID=A0A1G1YVQ3_9BACT|nr:MAG: hypothetical protein A2Y84_01005 [Candidatus Colwellbacteria bacterium RBG_13_48_8]